MKHRQQIGGRNVALRNDDLTPPNGAKARAIANQQGPMDETGLEQIASFAEREPTWTLGKVTAERLRMLADKLRAENELDADARLDDLEAHLTATAENPGRCSITPIGARDYLRAIRILRTNITAANGGWKREREHSLRLEQLVVKLYDKLQTLGAASLDVVLVKGDAKGDEFGIDLYSDLALELAALDGSHKR